MVSLTEAEWEEHRGNYDGLCVACGSWTSGGVEPDARKYHCELCEADAVFGAEEVLLYGHVEIVDEETRMKERECIHVRSGLRPAVTTLEHKVIPEAPTHVDDLDTITRLCVVCSGAAVVFLQRTEAQDEYEAKAGG